MVVGEEALTNGVDEFLVGNGEKFPLTDGLDALYLFGGDIDAVVHVDAYLCLLYGLASP